MLNNLFFWIQGIENPAPVDIGEPLGIDFRLIYSPTVESQEFLIFFDKNEVAGRWDKAALGKWNNEEGVVEVIKFAFPVTIPLNQGWRNSLITWQLNAPIDTNICYELYKTNKGASFSDRDLYLVDILQQISGKPLNEVVFDNGFDSGTVKVNKYESLSTQNGCELSNQQMLESEISNLRVVPPGELPENFQFELLSLGFING